MVTDVYNGVKLVEGPDPDSTMNHTALAKEGVITEPHPIWGGLMLGIPFLPMLFATIAFAFLHVNNHSGWSNPIFFSALIIYLISAVPFTIVATPVYIVIIIFWGYRGVFLNKIGKIQQIETPSISQHFSSRVRNFEELGKKKATLILFPTSFFANRIKNLFWPFLQLLGQKCV